jgi:hypothetical protein
MKLSSLIKQFESECLSSYKDQLLPSHRKALKAMKCCRSEYSPLMKMHCQECDHQHYVPHSCGHRSCPHCQAHESEQWIQRQLERQVPTRYALITFTVPSEYRALAWSHQRTLYGLMFTAVWETLQRFCQNDRQLKGTPGVIAVLHTHSRRLDYHPHIHVVMPMGVIDQKQRLWRQKNDRYLFSHKALASVFRAKMLAGIKLKGLTFPRRTPKKWVVDCRTVGHGREAITYLGRYLYRGVLPEKNILYVKEGKVTFRYQDGKTKAMKTRTVKGAHFLWLLLQHVLPGRFRRSRQYGFLHPNSKKLLPLLRLVFKLRPPCLKPDKPRPAMKCPCCGAPMRIALTRLPANPMLLKEQLSPI